MTQPVLIICMRVSSCGKTTLGRTIAAELGLKFIEADDFHGPENQAWMASGKPLTDEMRAPWIDRICQSLQAELGDGNHCVLACSALRRSHRDRFRQIGFNTCFLFLDGESLQIEKWIQEREEHFMPPGLLASQFEDLESPLGEPGVFRLEIDGDWTTTTAQGIEISKKTVSGIG